MFLARGLFGQTRKPALAELTRLLRKLVFRSGKSSQNLRFFSLAGSLVRLANPLLQSLPGFASSFFAQTKARKTFGFSRSRALWSNSQTRSCRAHPLASQACFSLRQKLAKPSVFLARGRAHMYSTKLLDTSICNFVEYTFTFAFANIIS